MNSINRYRVGRTLLDELEPKLHPSHIVAGVVVLDAEFENAVADYHAVAAMVVVRRCDREQYVQGGPLITAVGANSERSGGAVAARRLAHDLVKFDANGPRARRGGPNQHDEQQAGYLAKNPMATTLDSPHTMSPPQNPHRKKAGTHAKTSCGRTKPTARNDRLPATGPQSATATRRFAPALQAGAVSNRDG